MCIIASFIYEVALKIIVKRYTSIIHILIQIRSSFDQDQTNLFLKEWLGGKMIKILIFVFRFTSYLLVLYTLRKS